MLKGIAEKEITSPPTYHSFLTLLNLSVPGFGTKLLLVLVWRKFCQNCYYKNTHSETYIGYTFFLLTIQWAKNKIQNKFRTKMIGSLKGIYWELCNTLRLRVTILESSTETNYLFTFWNLKRTTSLFSSSLVFLVFSVDRISVVSISFLSYRCIIPICLCVISLTITVRVLARNFDQLIYLNKRQGFFGQIFNSLP